MIATQTTQNELMKEIVGSEAYEYYPLGDHVVAAPGVCGGRPTFKYTRLEVSIILTLLSQGHSVEQVVKEYALSNLTLEAVREAIHLANQALLRTTETMHPAAA